MPGARGPRVSRSTLVTKLCTTSCCAACAGVEGGADGQCCVACACNVWAGACVCQQVCGENYSSMRVRGQS
ncbi:hypothetical protein CHLRE_06g298802v5 [Chlamydomonas reinhardtii]|uniref:Secreted protein n=1 Tax=Chlamydomonas reinhardtii TaxID=3055 RepID=A0A2K3DQZ0_CHLRE|nr:uncharacterized protein CHLRE_06g298802v5 [Chlamydomonas reinhardtii]PNW82898.1 hypothetical protein CHLRE_06g298802v5 [Chlamydomonas reinhardtii]